MHVDQSSIIVSLEVITWILNMEFKGMWLFSNAMWLNFDLFPFQSHEANSNAVRFRVCQLINRLLGSMPENALIDDDLFDKLNKAMFIRLKDKIPNVRIQAVLALSRLQDPKDDECPVANGMCSSLNPFSVLLTLLNPQ